MSSKGGLNIVHDQRSESDDSIFSWNANHHGCLHHRFELHLQARTKTPSRIPQGGYFKTTIHGCSSLRQRSSWHLTIEEDRNNRSTRSGRVMDLGVGSEQGESVQPQRHVFPPHGGEVCDQRLSSRQRAQCSDLRKRCYVTYACI
jgi:hypothetical protein